MTSSPTREVAPDMLSAVLADHDERRPCPTPCRDQSERGGCLCAITAATIRALADQRDAARAEAARLREALKRLAMEATYMAQQLAARGLPGVEGDSVDRALTAARAALAGEAGRD